MVLIWVWEKQRLVFSVGGGGRDSMGLHGPFSVERPTGSGFDGLGAGMGWDRRSSGM